MFNNLNFHSVSDVWNAAMVDDSLVLSTAASVLERHAAVQTGREDYVNSRINHEDSVMPNCYPTLSKHHKAQAMQRLATQRGNYFTL